MGWEPVQGVPRPTVNRHQRDRWMDGETTATQFTCVHG